VSLFGTFITAPLRILNVPAEIVDKAVDTLLDDCTRKKKVLSKPLDDLAKEIEETFE